MSRLAALVLLAAAPAVAARAVAADSAHPAAGDRGAILRVVARMEQAWNREDFRGYMAGFAHPGVVFVSGGRFQDGW